MTINRLFSSEKAEGNFKRICHFITHMEPRESYWPASRRELLTLIDVVAFQYEDRRSPGRGRSMVEKPRVNIIK